MIAEINRDQAPAEKYDIIVIGGGAAGIAAAVGARRCGSGRGRARPFGPLFLSNLQVS
jgi:alkyl hydroperoxide reductase subunit AhpF